LSVTAVEAADLEQPPVAGTGERACEVARRLRATGARWAVVLDASGGLHGWASARELARVGATARVGESARRMEARVPLGAPLKRAFGELLQHDAGWVAVLDGERFVGVLTPVGLHEALRRSVDADARGVSRGEVDFSSVSGA
jgi:osmoprotectant transport system ATP-binding protein